MTTVRQRTHACVISGPAGNLQAMVSAPQYPANYTCIISHPHPLHQGTMHNKVVTTTAKACDALNMHTIRFNFRGVGDSAGHFDNGVGECDDLRAVYHWAQSNLPEQPIIFAGFSFGSYVSARTASSEAPTALITIAPAVSNQDYAQHPEYSGPWQVILADQDTITPIEAAQTWLAKQPHQPHVHIIEGACHFFHGKLDILEQTIQQFLKKACHL